MNGNVPGLNFALNAIVDAGPAGGGAGVQGNVPRVNVSYTGSGFDTVTAMPTAHITSIPEKRKPSVFFNELLDVEDGMGQIPPGETAVNGTFKNQPVSNPQKSVFLTYEAGSNFYHDCKLPIKINIPGGDFGLFKVTVNEVLFRNDAPLIDWKDWLLFDFKNFNMKVYVELVDQGQTITGVGNRILNQDLNFSQRFNFNEEMNNIAINYLTINTLMTLLRKMGQMSTPTQQFNIAIPQANLPILQNGQTQYVPQAGANFNFDSRNIISANINYTSGNGLAFTLNSSITARAQVQYQDNNLRQFPADVYIQFEGSFDMSCSDHFRNLFPAFSTVTKISSKTIPWMNRPATNFSTAEGIRIPWVNFAGPLVFMLNTNAQTTCPIANESASQFKTCALSYNTDTVPQQLVQMTSNIPLILKEGSDFRVSLTDMYGNPVKLQSPMYIQVTVSPFSNQAMAELISQM